MATIREVAERAGVAPMTVSRVLHTPDAVAADTRSRVEAAIAELDYVPNVLGQNLRNRRSNSLGLVLSDIRNPFVVPIIGSVEEVAARYDCGVLVANSQASSDREYDQLRSLIARRVDGIVLVPVLNDARSVGFVQGQGIPISVLGYPMPENDVDVVRTDSTSAADELTSHVIGLGHRRLAMITGRESIITARERANGFEAAIRRANLPMNECPVIYGEFDPVASRRIARSLLESPDRPTALVTANNFIALGVAHAAADLGLEIPRDLTIVTFDAPDPDYVLDPYFTSFDQPLVEMGSLAAEMLFDRIHGKETGRARDVILPMRFEQHSSSAPPA